MIYLEDTASLCDECNSRSQRLERTSLKGGNSSEGNDRKQACTSSRMGCLMLFVEETGHYPNCLGKGGGLAGHGDEEMGGCGEDMVSEPVAKSLQPLRQLGGLVEEDVVTRRDEAHGRQEA